MGGASKSSLRKALLNVLEREHLAREEEQAISAEESRLRASAYDAVRLMLADELAQIVTGKHQGDPEASQ